MHINMSDIYAASERIAHLLTDTALTHSQELTHRMRVPIFFKCDFTQHTGSFKLRGAANKILYHANEGQTAVNAASTGNHGKAVAYVAKKCDMQANVYVSKNVVANKVSAIKAMGAHTIVKGDDYDEAFNYAVSDAEKNNAIFVPPFDDALVIAGQGTIALEVYKQNKDINTMIVPLSGGGLLAGAALALKSLNPHARVIGVCMDHGAAMASSLQANKPVKVKESMSIADSLMGGIGLQNKYTFAMVKELMDDVVLLNEHDIKSAMHYAIHHLGYYLEGAAAVTIGSLLKAKIKLNGPTALLLTGKNVDPHTMLEIAGNKEYASY